MEEETNESPIAEINEDNDHDPLMNEENTIFGKGKQIKKGKQFKRFL
jgi:hypothetical protein